MTEFLQRLKTRKLVQWALAYVAFAFALLQGVDIVAQRFAWPDQLEKILILVLAVGFFAAVVLAWYHGERGVQKVSSTEIVILALLLAIGGGLLWRFARGSNANGNASLATAPAPNATTTHSSDAAQRNPGAALPTTPIAALPAKSIAVLPFVNMSGDAKNDYFSDGITEEILDALAQLPNLKVAARTSAFAFKGKAEDLRKVGEVLDVATVLEGSVQKAGDEVRITAQLIDTRSGYHLWSEKYDRKLTSIFAVEDEISKAIADKLQVQLAGGSGSTLVAQKTIDPRAHDFYLRGLTLLAARSVTEAVDAFQQAVAIDPDYAQAWAALAEAQVLQPAYSPVPMDIANTHALASAQRALALNPDTALAYVAQGIVYSNQTHWADADRVLQRALALAPGDAEVLNQYAQFLEGVGQLEPALVELDRSLQRDPLSGTSGAIRVQLRLFLHRIDADAAAAQMSAIVQAHPDSVFVHRVAMLLYLNLHRYSEAETQIRMAATLNGADPALNVALIRGIADPAQRARAVQILETSQATDGLPRQGIVRAMFFMELDEYDRALAELDNAANRDSSIPQLLWFPVFNPIRNDPRFKAALQKMGLPYVPAGASTP